MKFSKYHNKKTTVNGITFDSKAEARRYQQLSKMAAAGFISDLELQVPFVLIDKSEHGRAIKYIADFVYYENGQKVIEDCKGFRTDVYKLKKRLMAERYGIEIRES